MFATVFLVRADADFPDVTIPARRLCSPNNQKSQRSETGSRLLVISTYFQFSIPTTRTNLRAMLIGTVASLRV